MFWKKKKASHEEKLAWLQYKVKILEHLKEFEEKHAALERKFVNWSKDVEKGLDLHKKTMSDWCDEENKIRAAHQQKNNEKYDENQKKIDAHNNLVESYLKTQTDIMKKFVK